MLVYLEVDYSNSYCNKYSGYSNNGYNLFHLNGLVLGYPSQIKGSLLA